MMNKLFLLPLVFPILFLFPAKASALSFSLADVVGGGDGTGTGTPDTGINPRNGNIVNDITGGNNNNTDSPNIYSSVPSNPYVDGVFVPDGNVNGTNVSTPITSTGITANLPDTDSKSFENGIGFNSACCGSTININGTSIDVFNAPNEGIGFHSNKGITFDLDAIRAANPGNDIVQYTALVGKNTLDSGGPNSSIGHQIFLDGVQQAADLDIRASENATSFDIPINSSDRFLTLVGTNGTDGIFNNDQGIIANPTLTSQPTPVPFDASADTGLFALGGTFALSRLRKKLSTRKKVASL